MKIIEFHAIMKIIKILKIRVRITKSISISESLTQYEKLLNFNGNHENHANHIIPLENYENLVNLQVHMRIKKIMKIIKSHMRKTKIMKIL